MTRQRRNNRRHRERPRRTPTAPPSLPPLQPLTAEHFRAWVQGEGGDVGSVHLRQAADILRRGMGWVSGRYLTRIERRYQRVGVERQFMLRNFAVMLAIYMRRWTNPRDRRHATLERMVDELDVSIRLREVWEGGGVLQGEIGPVE